MKQSQYIAKFLILAALVIGVNFVFAQETTDLNKLENEITSLNNKLNESTNADEREKIFQRIASLFNQISEIHFAKGEYELSTKTSLEADVNLKKYHQSYFDRIKIELANAENGLKDAEKETNAEKRELLLKVRRILVIAHLKTLFEEAEYFGDETTQKTYLERLGQISREAKDLNGEAESLEKLGQLLLNAENPQESFALFEKALELRQKDRRKEFLTVNYIANAHYYLGNYDKAIEYFQKEGEITEEILAKTPAIKPEMTQTQKQIIELE
ncbi:MAG TPA: tetratricopeptide repeat protein, partial [Pyrinomonadaceae bacterium]|nr:tetratricopeptide repeat protein [Pyrinomonadaceae bacterium]